MICTQRSMQIAHTRSQILRFWRNRFFSICSLSRLYVEYGFFFGFERGKQGVGGVRANTHARNPTGQKKAQNCLLLACMFFLCLIHLIVSDGGWEFLLPKQNRWCLRRNCYTRLYCMLFSKKTQSNGREGNSRMITSETAAACYSCRCCLCILMWTAWKRKAATQKASRICLMYYKKVQYKL